MFSLLYYKPDNNRRVGKHVNKLFNEYYENKLDIKQYDGIRYVPFDKDYDEEKYDSIDSLQDEVSKIEKFYKIYINNNSKVLYYC